MAMSMEHSLQSYHPTRALRLSEYIEKNIPNISNISIPYPGAVLQFIFYLFLLFILIFFDDVQLLAPRQRFSRFSTPISRLWSYCCCCCFYRSVVLVAIFPADLGPGLSLAGASSYWRWFARLSATCAQTPLHRPKEAGRASFFLARCLALFSAARSISTPCSPFPALLPLRPPCSPPPKAAILLSSPYLPVSPCPSCLFLSPLLLPNPFSTTSVAYRQHSIITNFIRCTVYLPSPIPIRFLCILHPTTCLSCSSSSLRLLSQLTSPLRAPPPSPTFELVRF